MGGDLKLDSTLGKGSTFYFQLQFSLATQDNTKLPKSLPPVSKKSGGPKRLKGLRILVVEDNKINQLVAQGLLTQEGANITLANNGQLGVAAVAQASPAFDAVLMDLQMPVMDGYDATRAIRQELGLTDLPIIAMTANAMESDRIACLEAGMNDHVGKPFELDHLVALLLEYTTPPVATSTAPEPLPSTSPTFLPAPVDTSSASILDIDGALSRMDGNTVVFASILDAFTRDAVLVPGQLESQLSHAQSLDAVRTLHTIKGLAATVGATQLAAVSAKLEARAKTGIDTSDHSEVVMQLRNAVDAAVLALMPVLQRLSPAPVAHTGPEMTAEQLRADITVLLDLLKNSNMQAVDVFDQIRQRRGDQWNAVVNPLGVEMGRLDFAAAANLCEVYLKQSTA
jgi:CheY-like chemotaxis protein